MNQDHETPVKEVGQIGRVRLYPETFTDENATIAGPVSPDARQVSRLLMGLQVCELQGIHVVANVSYFTVLSRDEPYVAKIPRRTVHDAVMVTDGFDDDLIASLVYENIAEQAEADEPGKLAHVVGSRFASLQATDAAFRSKWELVNCV